MARVANQQLHVGTILRSCVGGYCIALYHTAQHCVAFNCPSLCVQNMTMLFCAGLCWAGLCCAAVLQVSQHTGRVHLYQRCADHRSCAVPLEANFHIEEVPALGPGPPQPQAQGQPQGQPQGQVQAPQQGQLQSNLQSEFRGSVAGETQPVKPMTHGAGIPVVCLLSPEGPQGSLSAAGDALPGVPAAEPGVGLSPAPGPRPVAGPGIPGLRSSLASLVPQTDTTPTPRGALSRCTMGQPTEAEGGGQQRGQEQAGGHAVSGTSLSAAASPAGAEPGTPAASSLTPVVHQAQGQGEGEGQVGAGLPPQEGAAVYRELVAAAQQFVAEWVVLKPLVRRRLQGRLVELPVAEAAERILSSVPDQELQVSPLCALRLLSLSLFTVCCQCRCTCSEWGS